MRAADFVLLGPGRAGRAAISGGRMSWGTIRGPVVSRRCDRKRRSASHPGAAARSAFGTSGGLAASGIIIGTVAWQPLVAAEPYWNPWFGVLFFLATLAAGLAVVSGRRRWWPVLVLTAS